MPKGVLDNMAALHDFFRGPFADLMVKLTGPHSLFYQTQLNKLLRMNPEEVLVDKLAALIEMGKYNWVNPEITPRNFPVTEIPILGKMKLFCFHRSMSSEDAKVEMEKKGFRPATMAELLVYGAKNPGMQRQFRIVALGSVAQVDRCRRVGVLDGDGSLRRLGLGRFDDGWNVSYRFLAVRK